jgi:hypothetical protein
MDLQLRRVQRSDFEAVLGIAAAGGLPIPAVDRAIHRRFRNIVSDLGNDFDVATARARLRGFVHLTYGRDLLVGNRAYLVALVADAVEVRNALFERAIARARRRQCCDLTTVTGPWVSSLEGLALSSGRSFVDGNIRIDLQTGREQSVPVLRASAPGDPPTD